MTLDTRLLIHALFAGITPVLLVIWAAFGFGL